MNEIGTSPVSASASATVSSVATYFGHGTGSSASPYQIDPADFLVARAVKREFDTNNRTPFSYVVSPSVTVENVAAVIQFQGGANISGAVALADGGGRDMSMRLFRGVTQIGSSETSITWTAATADSYTLLIVSSGSAAYSSAATLRVQVGAATGDPAPDEGGAGILSEGAPQGFFPAPRGVALRKVGETGARIAWRDPGYVETPVVRYELEWSDGAKWRPMAETKATEWTERAGVSMDLAWRVRAVYAEGASEWVEKSILDLYSGGAAAQAAGDPVEFEVLTNSASARLEWLGASVGDNATWWPFGDIEGEDQGFSLTGSTYYDTSAVDLGEERGGFLDADVEQYLPDATIIRAADPAPASGASAAGRGVAFSGRDIDPRIWAAGASIEPVAVPSAESVAGGVAYRAEGLPRGVRLEGGILTGSPQVFEGASGVARITATAEGGEDHCFFAWQVVGTLKKSGGDGTHGSPHAFAAGDGVRDIRDMLHDGATDRAGFAPTLATWFRVRVPAGETRDLRLTAPEGEDFDIAFDGGFRETRERTEIVRLTNPTQRSAAFKIGVYRHAKSADHAFVNRNEEGAPAKPPVTLSLAPVQPAGLALAEEWDALTGAGAEAQNVAGEFDFEITVWTAPAKANASDPIAWRSPVAITPGTRVAVSDMRYVQWRIHIKKSRNRALKSVAFTFLELS